MQEMNYDPITICGSDLSIADIAAVSKGAKVTLSNNPIVLGRIRKSRQIIVDAVRDAQQIYGVTTLFGGMAGVHVKPEQLHNLQRVALWQHKNTTGPRLPATDVRAAMLLRANSLMKGVSGIRIEIIERYATFLNAGACPHVYQRGSIGASGDLIPLAYIGGSIVGLDPAFKVDLDGETLDSHSALARLGLQPIALDPKEGARQWDGCLYRCRRRMRRACVRSFGAQPWRSCAVCTGAFSDEPVISSFHPCAKAASGPNLDGVGNGGAG
jgi:phenylalanine ammonia-lyase